MRAVFPSSLLLLRCVAARDGSEEVWDGATHNVSRAYMGCHLDLGYSRQERAFASNMVFGESFEGNGFNVAAA
eukprot:gene33256-62881_t